MQQSGRPAVALSRFPGLGNQEKLGDSSRVMSLRYYLYHGLSHVATVVKSLRNSPRGPNEARAPERLPNSSRGFQPAERIMTKPREDPGRVHKKEVFPCIILHLP